MDGAGRPNAGDRLAATCGGTGGGLPVYSMGTTFGRQPSYFNLGSSSAALPPPVFAASSGRSSGRSSGLGLQPSRSSTLIRQPSPILSGGSSMRLSREPSVFTNGGAGLPLQPSSSTTIRRQLDVLGGSWASPTPPQPLRSSESFGRVGSSFVPQLTGAASDLMPERFPIRSGQRRTFSEIVGSNLHVGSSRFASSSGNLASSSASRSWQRKSIHLSGSSSTSPRLSRPWVSSGHLGGVGLPGGSQISRGMSFKPDFTSLTYGHRRDRSELFGSNVYAGTTRSATNGSAGLQLLRSNSTILCQQPGNILLDGSSSTITTLSNGPVGFLEHRSLSSELVGSSFHVGTSVTSTDGGSVLPLHLSSSTALGRQPSSVLLVSSSSSLPPLPRPSESSSHQGTHSEIVGSSGNIGNLEPDDNEEDLIAMYMDTTKLHTLCTDIGPSYGGDKSSEEAATQSEHALAPLPPAANVGSSSGTSLRIGHQKSRSIEGSLFFKPELLNNNSEGGLSSSLSAPTEITKKRISNATLAEINAVDPKRAKRILSNRISAAKSKERRLKLKGELQEKVDTLQALASTLSAKLTAKNEESDGFYAENRKLKLEVENKSKELELMEANNLNLNEKLQRQKHLLIEMIINDLSVQNSNIGEIQQPFAQYQRMQLEPDQYINQLQIQLDHQHHVSGLPPLPESSQLDSFLQLPPQLPSTQQQQLPGDNNFLRTREGQALLNHPPENNGSAQNKDNSG